jgi:hypothetical protein
VMCDWAPTGRAQSMLAETPVIPEAIPGLRFLIAWTTSSSEGGFL